MNNKEMEKTILQVPVEDIIPNRFQPRLSFDDTSLNDLALSIKQHGIIQPLVLRRKNDKYEIIAGERRFKAAKLAGLASVPAVISNLDDNASAEVAIVENIQRKDLTAIEEAKSFQALLDKGYMTQDELARKMGLSQSAISNKLRLLTLDESVQDAILSEKISERHARTLLKVPSHEKQKELLNKIINERLTVKQLEDEIKNMELTPNNEINVTSKPIAPKEEMLSDNNNNNNLGSIEDIYSNAMDIKDIIGNEQRPEELQPVEKVTPDAFFSNPEKMPNKFFNFLEDSAANMDTNEKIPTFEIPKHENTNPVNLINQTEDIEMLDDLITKSPKASDNNQDYLNYVIKTIRGLNLDSDKVRLEELASQLEKLYKLDPSIRQKLKDLYGFDIFNDDGTVNKEKLAIAMLMDAKNPNDQYDLKTLLTKLSANTSTGDNSNKSTTGNVTKVVTNDIGGSSQTTSTIAGAAAGLGATVAAVGGTTSKATGLAASAEEEALANEKELSDKDSKNSNILDGLKSEMNHVINSIKPSGNISTKQGNAAIMAGAGLGTASLAGGGIMDGGTIEYLGLGYKVIDFHTIAGFDDIKIGTWFMDYNDFEEEIKAYEKNIKKIY